MSDRVLDLMDRARDMKEGPERVALLEEAVREADVSGDVLLGFDARMDLIDAGVFGGFSERAIVAFSWCLARFDETPEEYDEYDLFWKYKWIINALTNYPTVSRQQIEDMQDDMERRFKESGFSLRPVHYFRAENALRMGDREAALKNYQKWKRSERDWMADCRACEQSNSVSILSYLDRPEEALKTAEPILAGRMKCTVVPQATYAHVVRPYLRLNQLEQAQEVYQKGYRMISRNPSFLGETADHLLTLIAAEDLKKAVRLFEKHLPWAVETANIDSRFRFYLSSTLFLELLGQQSKRDRQLILPASLPCHQTGDKYNPTELARWFEHETQSLADQFNQRNGNEYYNEFVANTRELVGME